MRWNSIIALLLFTVIMAGCNENKDVKADASDLGNIYLAYTITAAETNEFVTCKFQFLQGGADGEAIKLKDSASIQLDGKPISPDSSRFNGVYYEVVLPFEDFKGKHTIVFTSFGKKFTEQFEFAPFSLATPLPPVIKRNELTVKLKDFPLNRTPLRLVMTDTAFGTSWINQPVAVTNAELKITVQMLARLKNGPIGFELHREKESALKETTKAGGRITLTYSLKREFELVN